MMEWLSQWSTWIVFLQIVSYYVIWRIHKKTEQMALDFGMQMGLRAGFDVGYLRAMSDDDATRRQFVAAIQRKNIPPELAELTPRF